MLRIIVLGAAAGGGFPQWNCNCANCRRARADDPAARPLTQSSLAVSANDGASWYLLNASPDLRQQIAQTSALHPKTRVRHTPIDGVVLTNADVDHVTGLLSMREAQPFAIYGTSRVLAALKANAIFNILAADLVSWRPLRPDHAVEILGPDGRSGGLRVMPPDVPEFTHPGPADYLLRQGIDANYPGMDGALDRFQVLFASVRRRDPAPVRRPPPRELAPPAPIDADQSFGCRAHRSHPSTGSCRQRQSRK